MFDSLGDRIKRYEAAANPKLLTHCPVFIRVDGKAFHTWTKGMDRPFDRVIGYGMLEAARETAAEMTGFELAYTQSDEATFMLRDMRTYQTQPWFDNEVNKLVSTTASIFTAWFNRFAVNKTGRPAFFDARAFNVPEHDAPNVFVWRQKDWTRNSVQMLARAHYSHKELMNKRLGDLHDLLYDKGVNWADLDPIWKNGSYVLRDGSVRHDVLAYDDIVKLTTPEES